MKKLLFVCAFVCGISAVSFAQGGGGRAQTPDAMLDRLKTRAMITGITDDQATKIKAIYAVQIKSRDSLTAAMGGAGNVDYRAMMPKMQPITDATNAKITAVLTPDQAATFKKYNDTQAAAMKARMQGGN
jgi:protein CpxP